MAENDLPENPRSMARARLYVDQPLGGADEDGGIALASGQSHYLRTVLRLKAGDMVSLFNGRDGEWAAAIDGIGKGRCGLRLEARTRAQAEEPDLWLVFAPIKRARIDFVAQKATELGVSALCPVFTERTAVSRVNHARLRANAIEAAEQTERLTVPEVFEAQSFGALLRVWPAERRLLVCDETGAGAPIADVLAAVRASTDSDSQLGAPWAILTGPEGGFSPAELDALAKLPIVTRVSLGPRVLRADTAAIAALACWQAWLGDWRQTTRAG